MFEGFTYAAPNFMADLYFNNERLWFEAHKETFQREVQYPMKALAQEVFEALDKKFQDRRLSCKVSRIYKDARIYKGISCYKESMWFTIYGPGEYMNQSPCFWFELDRNEWSYGFGFYHPSPALMNRHRQKILEAPELLTGLYTTFLGQREFRLEGEFYKKFKPGAPAFLAEWFNYRDFSLIHQDVDFDALGDGPKLVRRLVDGFSFLMPFYDYFYPLSDAANP